MFRRTLYILSNGEEKLNWPYLFEERDSMIAEAKKIEAALKHTKKLSGAGFYSAYLEDEEVLKYRELMRKIWSFTPDNSVVEIVTCCDNDKCTKHENLVDFTLHFHDTGYSWDHIYCQECAEKQYNLWSGLSQVTVTMKPHEEIF